MTVCTSTGRRRLLHRRAEGALSGIDEVEVEADPRRLRVSFLGPVPQDLRPENIRIDGGRRVTGLVAEAVEIDRAPDDRDSRLLVRLDRAGDGTTYGFRLVERGPKGGDRPHRAIDPRYAEAPFRFGLDCPDQPDCLERPASPESLPPGPDIPYTAKDYEGFRALMLDRLALTIPEWRPRAVPDLGMTLVEALAFHADRLSYLQDAVAAEAYLETARRRASVRRHLRLVGYRLHEGVNARAFLALTVAAGQVEWAAQDVAFAFGTEPGEAPLPEAALDALPGPAAWFEALGATRIEAMRDRNRIRFWTWMETACVLPRGATSATLRIEAAKMQGVEFLVLGEAADPARRHPVRLTRAVRVTDPLAAGEALTEVGWDAADALPFPLRLAVTRTRPPCEVEEPSVVWGNVVLVDHGRSRSTPLGKPPETVEEACLCGRPARLRRALPRWRPVVPGGPLVHAAPLRRGGPTRGLLGQDPAGAAPSLRVTAEDGAIWTAMPDLLRSGPGDRHLVVEPDDPPTLRFGDGRQGEPPPPGTDLRLHWREGGGRAGDLPPDAEGRLVVRRDRAAPADGVQVLNLLPAAGLAPEPLEQARREGPLARRGRMRRAVLAEDYATIARQDPALQGAAARLAWTGSWYAAEVALDPLGAAAPSAALLRRVARRLLRARRIGHDLEVEAAQAVPIELGLTVCPRPGAVPAELRAAVREALGLLPRRDGRPGFFHPDRIAIGAPLHGSALVAEIMALPAVLACRLDHLRRRGVAGPALPPGGVLRLGSMETPRLEAGGLDLSIGDRP